MRQQYPLGQKRYVGCESNVALIGDSILQWAGCTKWLCSMYHKQSIVLVLFAADRIENLCVSYRW